MVGEQRATKFRATAAAVLNEELHDLPIANKVGAINDRAAAPLVENQTGARQHGKVRGHRVLRNCEQAGEFASRDPVRLAAYEELERLEASGLSKGRKSGDSYGRIHRIHIARFISNWDDALDLVARVTAAVIDSQGKIVMDRLPYPFIQMNPEDMKDLGLSAGDLVEVYNDNGATQAMAYPTPTARRKQTFMLFAYPMGVQGNVFPPASTN